VVASPGETASLLYSLIKLRFPQDDLISALINQAEVQLDVMSPKDHALVLWSLVRINYPVNSPLSHTLQRRIYETLQQVKEEDYLFEKSDTVGLGTQLDELTEEVNED